MAFDPHYTGSRRLSARIGRILLGIVIVIALIAIAFLVYANIVMPADRTRSIEVRQNPAVSVTTTDHSIVMTPTSGATGTGLVFIPGAKVDPYAYLYKLSGIVESAGVTVVITEPTLNLAFFDQRPLSTFQADAPDVTTWFVGGHSLGGVRACQLAQTPGLAGLVLFGSYCANDLSSSSLAVLSIGGSEDRLSTPQKIQDAAVQLPASADFVEIAGLNHAGFGDYGVQPGDGVATLTTEQERDAITENLRIVLAANR